MAKKNNNKKEGKVTAGELFDRLKPKNAAADEAWPEELELTDGKAAENGFSIDATSGGESDSELDINELLKKYMPEYGEDDGVTAGAGVLSKLKHTAESTEELSAESTAVDSTDDELFSSALDSAFASDGEDILSPLDFSDMAEDAAEELDPYETAFAEERSPSRKPKKEKKRFSFFGLFNKSETEDVFLDGIDASVAEDAPSDYASFEDYGIDELTDAAADEFSEAVAGADEEFLHPVLPKEEIGFHTTEMRLGDLAEVETVLNEPQPGNRITPETKPARLGGDDDLLKRLEVLELETATEPELDAPAASAQTPLDDLLTDELSMEDMAAGEQYDLSDFGEGEEPAADFVEGEETASDESIDPTDLNLRVAFGLDEEGKAAEAAAAKEFGDKLEERQYKRQKRIKLDRPEFVDKTQIPKLRKEYKSRLVALWVKLGLAIVFAVLLMWFENITFFTRLFTGSPKQFAGLFDPAVYPVVYMMASLQLMLLACLCAYEQIIDGFKYLLRGVPRAESALSFMVTVAVIYAAVLARVIEVPDEPVMFNFVVALGAVLSLVYAIYNTKREQMNFEIVSSKKTKHIVRRLPDEESACEAQAFTEQADVCDVMKIEKTDFIDGFFGRIHKPDPTVNVFMIFLMSVATALGVLVGFFVGLRGGSAAEIMNAGFITLLIGAPLSVFVAFSYPFYRATLAAKAYDSAIIGDASLTEYSNASIIIFDDKNVFPSYSVKIQNIKIFNNARVDRVLYYAASVFAYAGGPLQDVFEVTTLDMGHSEDVKIYDTEAGFLATQVNGVNIIFGNYRTLTAKGFDIPVEYASDDVDFTSELSVMYMFREDKLVAKMYIKYVMDGDIDLILKQFQGTGLYVCVRTFDPNIDERMIAKKLNMRKIPLKVVRYASTEEVTMYEEKVDSGLVTSASPKSLLQIISYCDKVLHTRKANIAFAILSVIIGVAVMGLMLLSDTVGVMNSLFVALYHLLWMIPMAISSRVFIR